MEWQRIVLVVAGLGLASACETPRPTTGGSQDRGNFVFRGTVAEAGASTLSQIAPSESTYQVNVDEVVYQEGSFDDQTGRSLTLVSSRDRLEPGAKYLFYTDPFVFGETVGARLVRSTRDDRPSKTIGEEVRANLEADRLRERVREAELIVVGKVARVDSMPRRTARIESEHLPDLRLASVSVTEVLKGELTEDQVAFLFAASRDVQWYQAPKFSEGMDGIFLLNRDTKGLERLGVGESTYTLLHRLDYQPAGKRDLIRSLLQ